MVKIYDKKSTSVPPEIKIIQGIADDLDGSIAEIEDNISESHERTYPGIFDKYKIKFGDAIVDASAFDQRTIQDVKYHEEADEIYYVLRGCIRIAWKSNGSQNWENDEIVKEKECVFIPNNTCLVLKPATDIFLAVAFKTKISKLVFNPKDPEREPGKIQGTNCLKECNERAECEVRQKIRTYFFDLIYKKFGSKQDPTNRKIDSREKAICLIRKLL